MSKAKRMFSSILSVMLIVVLCLGGTGFTYAKTAAKSADKVVITYANWNLGTEKDNNLERRIVKAFEDSHPNITIKFADNIDYSKYAASLQTAASAGKLPDVMMLDNIPGGISNEWLMNIKSMISTDKEWNSIPKPIKDATYYGKGVYAVPAGMYFMGYFVNDDIFNSLNVKPLTYAPKMNDFFDTIKKVNVPSKGIVGLAEEVQLPEWYPGAANSKLGWFTWDNAKYNLTSKEFTTAIYKAKELYNNKYVYDSLTDSQKKQYNAGWYGDVWNQGKIAVRWSGTWDMAAFSKLNFANRFIGVPNNRLAVVGDFMGISKSCSHPKEAYEFAKYITFGKDGIQKRLEIDKGATWSSLPLTTDRKVLDKYFAINNYPGLKSAFNNVDKGMIEGVKMVPGYVASRWTAPTGIKVGNKDNVNIGDVIWDCMRGKSNIADYKDQLNTLSNNEYVKASNLINKLTK